MVIISRPIGQLPRISVAFEVKMKCELKSREFHRRNSFHNSFFDRRWEIFNLALVKMLNYFMLYAIRNFISLRFVKGLLKERKKNNFYAFKISIFYCRILHCRMRVHWERLLLKLVAKTYFNSFSLSDPYFSASSFSSLA